MSVRNVIAVCLVFFVGCQQSDEPQSSSTSLTSLRPRPKPTATQVVVKPRVTTTVGSKTTEEPETVTDAVAAAVYGLTNEKEK